MKHILHNSEFQLDEILFKERNKEYGAYPLRRDANLILTKSVFLGVGLVAILSISPLLINAFRTKDIVKPPIEGKHRLWNIPQKETETPRKEEKKQKAFEKPKVIDTRLPEPKLNATNEHRTPKTTESNSAVPGIQTTDGNIPTIQTGPPVYIAPSVSPKPPTTATIDDNNPATHVDQEAVFKGGIEIFRQKVIQTFDAESFEGSGEKISSIITFIVEKDGKISHIKASGKNATFNKEAEITISKIKGTWKPAKLNGETVRSYFQFPISMVFE